MSEIFALQNDSNEAQSINECLVEPVNPYALLELDVQLDIDLYNLDRVYFEKQKTYHPDRIKNKSIADQQLAASYSAQINQAYKTLKDPLERLWAYAINQGLAADRQQNINNNPALVEKVFVLQDQLSDCNTIEDRQGFHKKLAIEIDKIKAEFISSMTENNNKALENIYYLTYLYKLYKDM